MTSQPATPLDPSGQPSLPDKITLSQSLLALLTPTTPLGKMNLSQGKLDGEIEVLQNNAGLCVIIDINPAKGVN